MRAPEGSAELERFADDLTLDLISGLARFSHLLVLSANATRHLVGDTIDVREIGTTLGARYVIEAAVRGSGEAFRISAQLVDSRSGTTIWTDRSIWNPAKGGCWLSRMRSPIGSSRPSGMGTASSPVLSPRRPSDAIP